MKCPRCGHTNREGAEFCRRCGQSLRSELVCPHCGHTNPSDSAFCEKCAHSLVEATPPPTKPTSPEPTSFAGGRYQVNKFLGEGGKKKVYLTRDTVLDRDVAFALIKTEKLDDKSRTRITREAQAMGRLGDHPNIVTIHDMGEHEGQPYIVLPVMVGGDVEGLIEKATEHRLPLDKAIGIGKCVCQGLEFAHSKGIIHRDLKPGNVWLSADGTAKIGDFGLAVAVDLSRLTQSGMMVGTVSYMPPEQAMGGKVTNKADLYSLGAMLYEMVTGRPPFVGDDSVAIIGQHINTSPVSPAWHRADLPPALETLILQLLEKDPQRRPAAASDVYQALESIEAGKISKEPAPEAPTLAENPLYRRVFVGREAELKQLKSAFDGALSGQGALMMVVGEPGIGKTALCEQISTYVTLRGGRTLVGHCYEEGSLSLPYLAFVEALRSYVLSREVKDLREELGTGAADVARIVSEIRERLRVKLRPKGDPEEERYRLMQAVTDFLSNAAAVQPLMVVLEDLHDADKGTLDMLMHVSRHLAGARLLIIGTYRDVEVDRSHPLSAAMAELRRVSTYGRVLLRGLNADEVRRMLESITREEIPWGLAEAVHRQTEGNPLFVQEVIRYLAEEGLITQKEGRWRPTKDTPLEMSIPEGLRDVIGKRLSLLSPECNQLLSVAAVIGREFPLDTLRGVANIKEDAFVDALKKAVQLSVLEERSQVGVVRYRFTHAFFRQTLYEELIAPQRLKMHQQVARSLEAQYAKRLKEHAAELAEHFSQSTDPADLIKAVEYGEMAAKRATDVYAYGEAARLLEQVLKVQEVLDPEDKGKRCDLLLALGDILRDAAQPRRALDVALPEAFSLAEDLGDNTRASRACFLVLLALELEGGLMLQVWSSPEAVEWTERADRYAEPGTAERAWADLYLGLVRFSTGEPSEGVALMSRGFDLARDLGDPEGLWYATGMRLYYAAAPQRAGERLHLAEEIVASSRAGLSLRPLAYGLMWAGLAFLDWGQRQRAEETWNEYQEIAERSDHVILLLVSAMYDGIRAAVDGRLEEAEQTARRMLARGDELRLTELAALCAYLSSYRPWLLLGKAEEALQFVTTSFPSPPAQALGLAHLGRDTEAAEILERFVVARPGIGSAEDETQASDDIMYLEAAMLVEHREAAGLLLDRFAGSFPPFVSFGALTCTTRHLGGAAALLGRYDEARKYYDEALKVATEIKFRPEIALTRLQLAELLLEHYPKEKAAALKHLDFAIKEFRDMKMQPSLERALRHKDILKA
ncbi:MAG: zinc-ribbon domain-containing protein [Dehalococcoidia bacterium]|nr:MAG: zinc-ribbon domain-containing protein [Dehalococcoidia bacterium]